MFNSIFAKKNIMNKTLSQLPYEIIEMNAKTPFFFKNGQLITAEDQFGVYLCTKGYIEASMNEQKYDVKAGDIFFYTPISLIHILNTSKDLEAIVFRACSDFTIPLIKKTHNAKDLLLMPNNPYATLNHEQFLSIKQFMIYSIKTIQAYTLEKDINKKCILEALIKSLGETLYYKAIYIYFSKIRLNYVQQTLDRRDVILQNFIFSLYHNYNKKREVSYYADEQCISSRYFSTIIKEKSGKTALEWIIQMVIINAKQMLEYSNASIKEITTKLNFPTQSFFGRYFKQYVGVSPKKYRNDIRSHVY